MSRDNFEISWGSLWRVFAIVLFGVFLFFVKDVLALLFLAIIISAALDAPVDWLEKKKIPRILGTLIIFLGVLAILSLILYTVVPVGLLELKHFLANLTKMKLPIFGPLNFSSVALDLNNSLTNWADLLFSGSASIISVIMSISGNLIALIVVLVLSFYLTVDREGVENFMRLIFPIAYEDYAVNLYRRVRKRLSFWLKGQAILMLVVGALVSLGLWFLDVDYSLILGVLAGLLEIVPIAGPIFAGVVAFLVATSQSFTTALYVLALFVLIQQLENHLLVPLVMKKTIGISPVIVVIAILMGSKLAGFTGIVLAVPVAMIFQELLDDWDKYKFRRRNSRSRLI